MFWNILADTFFHMGVIEMFWNILPDTFLHMGAISIFLVIGVCSSESKSIKLSSPSLFDEMEW